MNRPSQQTLWRLTVGLFVLALLDIGFTAVGLFYFFGEEGNPLIVALAELLPSRFETNERVITAVWLSKMSVLAVVLLAVHQAVKSEPARDDWVMFWGLWFSIAVYVCVIGSWGWYFVLVSGIADSQ